MYHNLPICMIGDFNSRTGRLDDFVTIEDNIALEGGIDLTDSDLFNARYELDALDICTERHNCDRLTNNNGYNLIEVCKCLDVHIVNGRIGKDLGCGKLTCNNASLVDYVIASPHLFTKITNFYVDTFDNFLSDKHNPICLSLTCNQILDLTSIPIREKYMVEDTQPQCFVQTRWDDTMTDVYKEAFNELEIDGLVALLDNVDVMNANQKDIDGLTSKMCNIYLSPAVQIGIAKEVTYNKTKQNHRHSVDSKPWFGKICKHLRSKTNIRKTIRMNSNENYKSKVEIIKERQTKQKRNLTVNFTKSYVT